MKRLICLTVACVLLVSCATTVGPRAKKKAGVGAFMGGLAGAATAILQGRGNDEVLAAAAAGAVAGAVVGYAIGNAQDQRLASRDDAAKRYAYDPNRGPMLSLENVQLSPPIIRPGSTAQIKMVYTVISPGELDSIPVAYSSSVYQDGERVIDLGQQNATVVDGGGTIEVTMPFMVPPKAAAGTYEFHAGVALAESGISDTAMQSFYIGS